MVSAGPDNEPTLHDLHVARVAIQALRLSAILVALYEVVYQYYQNHLTQADMPQGVLSAWMLIEFGLWLVGSLLLSTIPLRPAGNSGTGLMRAIDLNPRRLSQPATPGAIPPAGSPEGAGVRVLNGIALALLLIFVAIHQGWLPPPLEQRISLAYLGIRALLVWLVAGQFLALTPNLPAGGMLAGATRTLRGILAMAMGVWLVAWMALVLDAQFGLDLRHHGDRVLLINFACTASEWVLIAGTVGGCVVLTHYLRAIAHAVASRAAADQAATAPHSA